MRRLNAVPLAIASAVLAASTGLAACGGDDDGRKVSFNLAIGDSVPLTGDLSDFGAPGRKAADIAVAQIGEAMKKAGVDHKVTVKHEDNQTDPRAAVQAARKLVGEDVSCIAGAWAASDTLRTARSVAVREKVLEISPASTSDEITELKDDGFLNRTVSPDSFQGPALADAMEKALGGAQGKTVNIGALDHTYGTGLTDTFSEAWEEAGGRIGEKVVYDLKQPGYEAEAEKITSGNPDAFVIFDFPETFQTVGPALVRTGDFDAKKAFITDGLAVSELPKSAGPEATEGMRGTAPGVPDKGAASVAFDRLYTQSAPKEVERRSFDAQNFDAVILCYLAAVAAGSADGAEMAAQVRDVSAPPGDKYTWEQLPDAIEALQDGEDIDYEGASGPIDMNENGDATAGVYDLFEYRNGKIDITGEVLIPEE